MYTGKSKCQGCGRDGAERARASRLLLCPECQQLLLLGVAVSERSKARLIVTADGDIYCGGQKCGIANDTGVRCQDCALSKIGTKEETKKD